MLTYYRWTIRNKYWNLKQGWWWCWLDNTTVLKKKKKKKPSQREARARLHPFVKMVRGSVLWCVTDDLYSFLSYLYQCNKMFLCNRCFSRLYTRLLWCHRWKRLRSDNIYDCNRCSGLTWIPSWISNHMPSKVWDEITYPVPNFNEVWEWISNFIPHIIMDVIACCD